MKFEEVHIWDAELRGCWGGVQIEDEFGRSLCSWPMDHEEAEERARKWWPEARIVHHEVNWVAESNACPKCGERDSDSLVWIDDESVLCAVCGTSYKPGEVVNGIS